MLQKCTPVFEKEFLIHQLKREGYKIACCSNSIRESVEMMLRGSGIIDLFDVLVSNEDVSHPKPNPEMYLKACSILGVDPKETVMVEDAGHGIEAARAARGQCLRSCRF
ncbi:MAG: HAD family hydrolase [Chthoniobacteraceae bacterium]